jgi:predicted kinase
VKENEEYFSKEKEVFEVYVAEIECALRKGYTVWADATHLNLASRLKLLRALKIKPDVIDIMWVKTPLEVALERNEMRKGTRAYVPESAIRRMYGSIQEPNFYEGEFEYNTIYIKEPGVPIQIYHQKEENE